MTSPSAPTGGVAGRRPPPAVVAAAALAALQALLCLLPGLSGLSFGMGGNLPALAVGLGYLVLSAASVLGAVQAVRGRSGRVLTVVGLALAVVWAVNLVLSLVLGIGFDVLSVLLLVLAVGVVLCMRRPEVQAWAPPRGTPV